MLNMPIRVILLNYSIKSFFLYFSLPTIEEIMANKTVHNISFVMKNIENIFFKKREFIYNIYIKYSRKPIQIKSNTLQV